MPLSSFFARHSSWVCTTRKLRARNETEREREKTLPQIKMSPGIIAYQACSSSSSSVCVPLLPDPMTRGTKTGEETSYDDSSAQDRELFDSSYFFVLHYQQLTTSSKARLWDDGDSASKYVCSRQYSRSVLPGTLPSSMLPRVVVPRGHFSEYNYYYYCNHNIMMFDDTRSFLYSSTHSLYFFRTHYYCVCLVQIYFQGVSRIGNR